MKETPVFYQLRAQLEMPVAVMSSAPLALCNTGLRLCLLAFSTLGQIKIAITAHESQAEALHLDKPQRGEGTVRSKTLDVCSRMVKRAYQGWLKE